MNKIKTNCIKKGWKIKLANGWNGTMMDNLKGNTRMAEIEGYYTEIGSVYSWDIIAASQDGVTWSKIELTPAQISQKKMASLF